MAVHLSFLFILTGLTGIHSITTVSKVSVKSENSISIPCLYDPKYRDHVKYLCQGYYWNSCSYAVKTNQPSSGKFLISDNKTQTIFTVTIKDLTDQDTDYWCAVEINGGADVGHYFHLSVTKDTPRLSVDHQYITAVKGDKLTINCYHHNSGEMKWCRLGRSCVTESSGAIDGTRVTINMSITDVSSVTMSGLKTESSVWYLCIKGELQMPVHVTVTEQPTNISQGPTNVADQEPRISVDLKSLLIPLSLLIFTVMVTLFIWFMLKWRKQNREEPTATTSTEVEVTYSTVKKKKSSGKAEEEVTYSNVNHVRKTSGERSGAEIKSDVDVMYNSVFTVERRTVPGVEAKVANVTYSTLA